MLCITTNAECGPNLDSSSYYYASGLYMILIMEKFGIGFRDDLFERYFTLTELIDDKLK